VMGFGVDDQFNVIEGDLVPLSVPVGTLTLAEASRNVIFNGNLNASGSVGTTGSVHTGRAWFTDAAMTTPVTAATDLTTTDIYMSDGAGGSVLAFDSSVNPKTITISGVEKGGKDLGTKTFAFSPTAVAGSDGFGTTLGDYADFLEDVLGLDNSAVGSASNLGGNVAINGSGQLVITGNEGTVQELGLETADFVVGTPGSGSGQPLVLTKTGSANGESVRTSFVVYDSLGTPLTIDLTFTLQQTSASGGTTWQMVAESNDNDAAQRLIGLGEITFDASGRFQSASNQSFSVIRTNGAVSPLTVNMDFNSGTDAVSSLTDTASNLAAVFQDGSPIGTLSNFSIGEDGRISGSFTNGLTRTIGQIALAKFSNPEGLVDAARRQAARLRYGPTGRWRARALERRSLAGVHQHDPREHRLLGGEPRDHDHRRTHQPAPRPRPLTRATKPGRPSRNEYPRRAAPHARPGFVAANAGWRVG